MSCTVLAVAAHADDEVLGCGGTLARHAAEGDRVHVLFLADGVGSRSGVSTADIGRREDAARAAHEILGVSNAVFLGLPDNRLDGLALLDVVQPLEKILSEISPRIVYTHHFGDLNVDHRVAHQAVLTACRPQPGQEVREIYAFEIMSSTEWAAPCAAPFLPSYYVDISTYLPQKLRALEKYAEEMRAAPHSRSVEHVEYLARHRGMCVGVAAAEAFVPLRTLR